MAMHKLFDLISLLLLCIVFNVSILRITAAVYIKYNQNN